MSEMELMISRDEDREEEMRRRNEDRTLYSERERNMISETITKMENSYQMMKVRMEMRIKQIRQMMKIMELRKDMEDSDQPTNR